MTSVPNVPILGTKRLLNNGAKYVAQLVTTDGDVSYFAATFDLPDAPGGGVDLQLRASFNPMPQLLTQIEMAIVFGLGVPIQMPTDPAGRPIIPPLTFKCLGGVNVVPAQVCSFRFLGEVVGDDGVSILVDRLIDREPEVRRERYVYAPGYYHNQSSTPVSAPPVYGEKESAA